MKKVERERIKKLITRTLIPSKKIYYWSSYALKKVFEDLTGNYISHEDFKSMLTECGFEPTPRSRKEVNWRLRIEVAYNPAIDKYYLGRGCDLRYLESRKNLIDKRIV